MDSEFLYHNFGTIGPLHEPLQIYNGPSRHYKLRSSTGCFEFEIPKKGQKNNRRIDPILSLPIDAWNPHPNIELRNGFGVPVPQFWNNWTTS